MERRQPIIDSDIHPLMDGRQIVDHLAEPWRTRCASGNLGAANHPYWNPGGVRRMDVVLPDGTRVESKPELLAQYYLDQFNVEYAILNVDHLAFALTPEPDYAAALASATNDVLIHHWLAADPRFRAAMLVSPVDPQLAVREIERVGNHPGIVQVLMPSGAMLPYGNRFYHPIYAAAAEYDLPVAIHPGTEGVGISGAPTAAGYPGSYFEWHSGLVGNYLAHLISLVAEGVFVKYPTLKFVLIEGGAFWIPPLLWRLDKNWKALRQTVPWLDRPPSEIVMEHILLTTQPLEEPERVEHFRTMLGMFDAGHMLMFASDFPHWDGDTPDFAARMFPLDLRTRVMSETAREVYKLEAVQDA